MTGTQQFDVPAGGRVEWVGYWSAATSGTYFGCAPAGGAARRQFSVPDTTADTLESPAHGYSNGDQVVVWPAVGAALPTGLAEGTVYFVVSSTTDDFQLSATSGGAAINLTAVGDGEVSKITPEPYIGQGTYTVNLLQLSYPDRRSERAEDPAVPAEGPGLKGVETCRQSCR
jgi:hypothetical protein